MAIFDFVQKAKNVFGNNGGVGSLNDSRFQQIVKLMTGDSCNGKTYTPEEMMREYKSWVYTCANITSAGVASTPLRLYATTSSAQSNKYLHEHRVLSGMERKALSKNVSYKALSKITNSVEVIELVDHPLLDLLRAWNDERNYFESIESVVNGMDMIGNSYVYTDYKGQATPQDLYVLLPQYVKIIPGRRKLVIGYEYNPPGSTKPTRFRADEIIHFKNSSTNSILYGLGCAQAAAMAIERNELIGVSENSILKNKAQPLTAIKYKDANLSPESKRDGEREWNKILRGANKNGKIKIMDKDWEFVTVPSFKPEEMMYDKSRIEVQKEIAGCFGVPYSMVSSADTKKAVSEDAKLWLSENALVPRMKRIEEKLNEKLVPLYDDRLFLAFDNPIPENIEQETSTNDIYIANGVMSINEVRRGLGLAAYKDEIFEKPFAESAITVTSSEEVIEIEGDIDE